MVVWVRVAWGGVWVDGCVWVDVYTKDVHITIPTQSDGYGLALTTQPESGGCGLALTTQPYVMVMAMS